MDHFKLRRYCYFNASTEDVCKPVAYSLEYADKHPYFIQPITESSVKCCPTHGTSCLGHLEAYGDMLFLPSWMTPSSKQDENRLFVLKKQCLTGRAPYEAYMKGILATLRGKGGYARSVSRMSVQGSLRMVISCFLDAFRLILRRHFMRWLAYLRLATFWPCLLSFLLCSICHSVF